jgi:hypothetical protein
MKLNLVLIKGQKRKKLVFQVRRMVNGGYCGRNQDEIRKHMEEVKKLGSTEAFEEIPVFFPVVKDRISLEEGIEVLGLQTSGEGEFAIMIGEDDIYIGAASDHTDRDLEKQTILKSKQVTPNILSREVWDYEDVKDHWDEITLRAWVKERGEKKLYQETKLAALLTPEDLIKFVKERTKGDFEGMVILSGTVAAIKGVSGFSDYFEVELIDDVLKRKIGCKYSIEPIDWIRY